jgi:Domain of unknown function (DUF4399)
VSPAPAWRACGLAAAGLALALGAATAAEPAHPWLTLPAPLPQPQTYFTNLKDGDRIETPFVLKFGLSRSGLAAITKDVRDTGHHHLLVNRELPLDFTQPLPFNDQYRHFGKGQMEAVLDFKPGTYTLRLLLADHRHIPFFIYSKPMTVTVTAKNDKLDAKTLVKPGVELLSPRNGEALSVPFRVQFHASGLNVSHTDIADAGVGHFRLVAQTKGGAVERIAFANGATEGWLKPPPGDYTLKLELVSNAPGGAVMASGTPVAVKVLAR